MKIDKLSTITTNSNRLSYNGKELDKDLNWYHYGARFYDPAVGRWWVTDAVSASYGWSEDGKVRQGSIGYGPGIGSGIIQKNKSNVIGVSISNILENTETAIRENIEDMLYITNPLRYRDYVYKDYFINSFDDKVIYKSYAVFHDDESITVFGYNEVID